jgi:hypothetical protein
MSKYKLIVKEGVYYSDNLFFLIIEIFKHRFSHLIKDGKWMD